MKKTRAEFTATSNVTVDEELQEGFRLTGIVQGDIQMTRHPFNYLKVTAISGEQEYPAVLSGARYAINLPAGTYTLRVSYIPQAASFTYLTGATYTDPAAVQVNADTDRNITVPFNALSTVRGSITGIDWNGPLNGADDFWIQLTGENLPSPGRAQQPHNIRSGRAERRLQGPPRGQPFFTIGN